MPLLTEQKEVEVAILEVEATAQVDAEVGYRRTASLYFASSLQSSKHLSGEHGIYIACIVAFGHRNKLL